MSIDYRNLMMEIGQGKYRYLGSGSARRVYDLGNGYVIKVAKNQKGIAQNKVEYAISSEDSSGIFADVFDISLNYKYLIMRKADQVKSFSEVLHYFGAESEHQFRDLPEIKQLAKQYDLARADLVKKTSWGMVDGNLVLIDYGFTTYIRQKYYHKRGSR